MHQQRQTIVVEREARIEVRGGKKEGLGVGGTMNKAGSSLLVRFYGCVCVCPCLCAYLCVCVCLYVCLSVDCMLRVCLSHNVGV